MYKRWIPLLIVLLLAALLYYLGVNKHLSLSSLWKHRDWIFLQFHQHPFLSSCAFFVLYVISIGLFLPASSILCFLSGMAYPLPYAILLGAFSETVGALVLFFLFRYSLSIPRFQQHAGTMWKKTEQAFQKGPVSYLLFFRISHLVPYWLINALAATLKTRTTTFLWTTFLGVLPFIFIVAEAGSILKHTFLHSPHFKVHELFSTKEQLILVAIALLALIPLIIKNLRKSP